MILLSDLVKEMILLVVDRHAYRFAYHFSLCELEEKVQTFTVPTLYRGKYCGCGIIDEYDVGNILPTRPFSVLNVLKLKVFTGSRHS